MTNGDGCGIISSFPREHGNPNKGKPKRNLANCINCWCGSMAEQLICNQQVVGSTPITSSNTVCRLRTVQLGGIPEWPKGTDCKSAGTAFGGSNPPSPISVNFRMKIIRKFFCAKFFSDKTAAFYIQYSYISRKMSRCAYQAERVINLFIKRRGSLKRICAPRFLRLSSDCPKTSACGQIIKRTV